MPSESHLRVGVLLCRSITETQSSSMGVQFLDCAPVDLLTPLEPSYLRIIAPHKPELAEKQGVTFEKYWISEDGPDDGGDGCFPLTSGAKVKITHSIATCPQVDILIIPGPAPSQISSPAMCDFIQAQSKGTVGTFAVCTGVFPLTQTFVLHGRRATAPADFLPMFREKAPNTTWLKQRYVQDGNIWTSGAVTNGLDMMAAFMREYFADRAEAVDIALKASAVAERGQEYAGAEMSM